MEIHRRGKILTRLETVFRLGLLRTSLSSPLCFVNSYSLVINLSLDAASHMKPDVHRETGRSVRVRRLPASG